MRFIYSISILIFALIACSQAESSNSRVNKSHNAIITHQEAENNSSKPNEAESTKHMRRESCKASISHDELRAQKELTFVFSEKCDSIEIHIPSGGTVTSAQLFSDSTSNEVVSEVSAFMIGESSTNYFTLPSNQKGRFYLSYGSCHWYSRLWISIE